VAIGALSSSAFAEGTDPLSAKLQALELGKVAPAAKQTSSPTVPAKVNTAKAQPPPATTSQANLRCEVKPSTKKKRKPLPKGIQRVPEKEKQQASLSQVLFESPAATVSEPKYDLPSHGELLQIRLANDSIQEEPDSLLGELPGAKMEVSSDRLSFTQERNFSGRQTKELAFPPTPTPQHRTDHGMR
jgi:hypothetical protein